VIIMLPDALIAFLEEAKARQAEKKENATRKN
jgi:hypothetical protein